MSPLAATDRDLAGLLGGVPAFTGREGELASLARVLGGPPAVVLVEGEAGIGKSRLLREYLATAGRPGAALVAMCPPLARPQTLGPVAEAVRGAAAGGVAGLGLSGLAGALRPLFPEWAAALPPAPEPAADASAARYRVFAALRELLERLGAGVLVVEDGHWADQASLEFVLYVASAVPPQVSVVVTYRPEDVPAGSLLPKIARLACGPAGLRLVLGPLDVAQTGMLVSSMLTGAPVSGEFAAFLHGHTGGVPLAVEESVRLLAGRDDLIRPGGQWVRRPLDQLQVPATIRDAVLERAGRLGADARAVLQAAAVLADRADDATIAIVAGMAAGRARAGLSESTACGLLAEDGRSLVGFRHALACRAVYEAIPGPDRRALHSRAGQVLETGMPVPVAQLARHFQEAGDTGRWCRYAEQAADLAVASGDAATAAVLLRDLIIDGGLSPRRLAGLLDKITFGSLADRARYGELVSALRSFLDRGLEEPTEQAPIRFELGRILCLMEDYSAGRAELERAVPHLADDPALAARAMTILGWPYDLTTPASVHLRWLRRVEKLADSLSTADRLRVLVLRVSALLCLGEEEGWLAAALIPADAGTQFEWHLITLGLMNTGELAAMWGRYPEAKRRLTAARELADAHGYQRYRESILASQAHLDWLTGAWSGLAARARHLADTAETQGARLDATFVVGALQAAAGDRLLATDCLRLVVGERLRRGEVAHMVDPAAVLARLSLADGRMDDVLEITDEPIAILARKRMWFWGAELAAARIEALIASRRIGEAAGLVTAVARGPRGRDAPAPQAALILCRAILADAKEEHARAAALFARAAAAWLALPRPYDALLARERQARCLLTGGSPGAGLALLGKVRGELAALGARGDADRVERTLREHGRTVPQRSKGGRPAYGDHLSPRELEVVRLVAAGRTNREIARVLCRSPNTVGTQLTSAMRKLRVSSRAALAAKVTAAGLTVGCTQRGPARQPSP